MRALLMVGRCMAIAAIILVATAMLIRLLAIWLINQLPTAKVLS